MTWAGVLAIAFMMGLAFAQNVSFSIVSRSRNRNNMKYHLVAAIFSNAVWFATSKFLIIGHDMTWALFVPYTIGTVSGSLTGQRISMYIEEKIGATS